jgi:hypothetical protein
MLEKLVPLQKRLNRIEAHIAQHSNLCSDPILLVHDAAASTTTNGSRARAR